MSATTSRSLQEALIRSLARLRRPLADFWSWWTAQLKSTLPDGISNTLLGGRRQIIIFPEDNDFICAERDAATGELLRLGTIEAAVRQRAGKAGPVDEFVLLLPADQALVRPITLPLAAEENLREVLSFELDRQTPFSVDQAYYDHVVGNRDSSAGTLTVSLVVAARQNTENVLDKLAGLGLKPDLVTVEDAAGQPIPVNLLPPERRPRRRALPELKVVLTAVIVLLCVAVLLLPLGLAKHALSALEQERDAIQGPAAAVLVLRRDIERAASASNFLIERKRNTVSTVRMLAEVTRVLPDGTWLSRVDISGSEVELRGQSTTAAELIELLESSPLFKDARFRSPVVQVPYTEAERFHISVQLQEVDAT